MCVCVCETGAMYEMKKNQTEKVWRGVGEEHGLQNEGGDDQRRTTGMPSTGYLIIFTARKFTVRNFE